MASSVFGERTLIPARKSSTGVPLAPIGFDSEKRGSADNFAKFFALRLFQGQ
jgi:hypothetical protein